MQCLVFEQCIEQCIRLLSAIVLLPQDGSESVPYGGQGSLFSFIDYYFITLLTGTNGDFSSLWTGNAGETDFALYCYPRSVLRNMAPHPSHCAVSE